MKKNQKAAASNTQKKTIFVFNKGICGNGGTTGIMKYANENGCTAMIVNSCGNQFEVNTKKFKSHEQ